MSGLGELDRPETPGSPGAWDARSRESLTDGTPHTGGVPAGGSEGGGPGAVTSSPAGGSARDGRGDTATTGRGAPESGAAISGWGAANAGSGTHVAGGALADGQALTGAGGAVGAGAVAAGGRQAPSAARRATADPVKALMHRHRDLCERAVDPLEIAAGLEAHGLTDRTAARFRHRDVFSLAEEMYARVPRDTDPAPHPTDPPTPRARAASIVLALLPGALCAAAVTGLRLTHGRTRLTVAALGVLAVALAVRAALRRGPLAATARTGGTWTCWLVGYALLGDGLLQAALAGGPDGLPDGTADGPWPVTVAPVLALTLACAPAAVSARLLAVRARRRLTASRGLADFSASVRPLLLGTFVLFMAVLTALAALTGMVLGEPAAYPQALTLGALLLLARLLTVHGHAYAPSLVLTAAATAEATALATLFAGRLPGCGFLAAPVEALVDLWGPAGVPTIACGAGALVLLVHATRRLTRASAHASTEPPR
ncbi:hypothetical protein ABZ177_07530 [Streptomyces sp. NPDC006284]|uniref:hypothetical protein n=1 Tax=Streptomyces sp. NPDC006284 TaxID=3156742 RepID=UPI0033A66CE6